MAKVPFSKLQAKIDNTVVKMCYCNAAGEEIYYEVKRYLPFDEKLELVTRIINQSVDDNGFYNPMKVKFNMTLETVYAYTNLSFTDKMKETPFKLYDILVSTGIFNDIIKNLNPSEWTEIQDNTWTSIKNIYDYKNSAVGLLDIISKDYSNLNYDAQEIQASLANPENMALLKDVLSKLG